MSGFQSSLKSCAQTAVSSPFLSLSMFTTHTHTLQVNNNFKAHQHKRENLPTAATAVVAILSPAVQIKRNPPLSVVQSEFQLLSKVVFGCRGGGKGRKKKDTVLLGACACFVSVLGDNYRFPLGNCFISEHCRKKKSRRE